MHRKTLIIILVLGGILYLVTSWNSSGYYQADEHYQIIEFAGTKLGFTQPGYLPWEYKAHIRSVVQPMICYWVFSLLNFTGFTDPYIQAFVLRLMTAIFALIVISFFSRKFQFMIGSKYKTWFFLLTYFTWFLPMLNVRFSSETWSGLFFLLAITFIYVFYQENKSDKLFYLIGTLLGISFLFRFQTAILTFFLLCWLFFIKHERQRLWRLILPFLAVLIVGILMDSWFYKTFTISSFNYLYYFILGKAAVFGKSPWHNYFYFLAKYPTYPIALLFFLCLIIITIRRPGHLIVWLIWPFIIIHSFIGHKELRFLFPLVNLFPAIIILGVDEFGKLKLIKNSQIRIYLTYAFRSYLVLLILINLTALAAVTFKSAGMGRMELTRYIHQHYKSPVRLITTNYANPYEPWNGLLARFYMDKNVTFKQVSNPSEIANFEAKDDTLNLFIARKEQIKMLNYKPTLDSLHYGYVVQSVPLWIEKLNTLYYGIDNRNITVLYSKKISGSDTWNN